MIYAKGTIVRYEPTVAGRKKAEKLLADYPHATAPVLKAPSYVELLEDFQLQPVRPVKPRSLIASFPKSA